MTSQERHISIHALREESDIQAHRKQGGVCISIHALREESDGGKERAEFALTGISIHALREESDNVYWQLCCYPLYFNPRPPRGERLCNAWSHGVAIGISIHALREESDSACAMRATMPRYFNPRPPRGERPDGERRPISQKVFQSTPSARRATVSPPVQGFR